MQIIIWIVEFPVEAGVLFAKCNVVSVRVLNGPVCCPWIKNVKSLWIPTATRRSTTHLVRSEEMEPRPTSRKSSPSQPVSSSDVSASSVDEDVENVASQQPQSTQWTLPSYSRMRVLHPFTGPPKGKSSEEARHSSPLHRAFWCCASRKLLCWLWRRIVTTTAWTVLTSINIHSVTWLRPKCLCLWL